MATDYISREAARPDAFCSGVSCQECPFCKDILNGGCRVDDFIMALTAADVVEVVYCRDCIHLGFKDFNGICNGPMCCVVKPWDYCSHGVKRT